MEVLEDDLFFADLSKQISLLIMDEEDDRVSLALAPPWSSYPLQDMSSYVIPSTQQGGQGILGHGQPRHRHVQEENQQLAMSKGTGVFIPKFAQPRRKRSTPNHNHHQNPPRHSLPSNYSRPATNYSHYRHHQHQLQQQQQQQHDFYYSARRFLEDESKASYYTNPNKF